MAVLSRKTCGLAIELINLNFTKVKLELLLYKYEIHQNYLQIENKDRLLRLVFQHLEEKGEYDRILNIIQEAMVAGCFRFLREHKKKRGLCAA